MSAAENVECASCGVTGYPAILMDEFCRMVPSCPACGKGHTGMAPPAATAPPSTDKKIPTKVLSLVRTAPAETDPVKLIQARLTWLDEELAKAATYKAESRRLRRMLKAAGEIV